MYLCKYWRAQNNIFARLFQFPFLLVFARPCFACNILQQYHNGLEKGWNLQTRTWTARRTKKGTSTEDIGVAQHNQAYKYIYMVFLELVYVYLSIYVSFIKSISYKYMSVYT